MDQLEDTEQPTEKQAPNGRFGRIPLELLPVLRNLSNVEFRVFSILCVFANFSREPLGKVEESTTLLAQESGLRRSSIYRTIPTLEKLGLVETVSQGDTMRLVVRHYLSLQETPPVSQGDTESLQPEQNTTTSKPLRRREEVKKEEVKRKRGKRAKKPAPPHPLNGLVYWDKEKRQVRFEGKGQEVLIKEIDDTVARENLMSPLSKEEMQLGWGKLNTHLVGAPFKTSPRTLPAIVLGWFQTDLRQKNLRSSSGQRKSLAQRIDEKIIERAQDGYEEEGGAGAIDDFKRLDAGNTGFND